MIKSFIILLLIANGACSSKEEFDRDAYNSKVRDTDSRFEKLYKDLDKETR